MPTPSTGLLKTCQTCFRAKIRCVKTQSSGRCDRCLRLDKQCVFAPSRRRNVQTAATSTTSSAHLNETPSTSTSNAPLDQDKDIGPFDIISFQEAANQLDVFRTKFSSHFPFVILAPAISVQELYDSQPLLCIAILTATCSANVKKQRALGALFNKTIASRLLAGALVSLDTLQALLVSLAWAQYQPRPSRYSQHLYLAASIVSDLRMDRPINPDFWTVYRKTPHQVQWSPDEIRAICGLFYLASNCSILLQKQRLVTYTGFLLDASQQLESRNVAPTDKALPVMVRVQHLIEQVEDIMAAKADASQINKMHQIQSAFTHIKLNLTFPLAEYPALLLQTSLLELMINQSSVPGASTHLHRISRSDPSFKFTPHLLQWLTESMLAAKSLLSFFTVVPSDNVPAISNTEWIILYCGMSLATRMDILARHQSIAHTTSSIRATLQIQHALRQAILRLDSATRDEVDDQGDRDAFYHLAARAKQLEKWYFAERDLTVAAAESASASASTAVTTDMNMTPEDVMIGNFGAMHPIDASESSATQSEGSTTLMDLVTEYGLDMESGSFPFAQLFNFDSNNASF